MMGNLGLNDNEDHLANKIYKELRNRICLRIYPQGAILKEEDIADEFCVSRTPVRESLQHLKLDGLVESKKRLGTVVTGFDDATIKELYEMRINMLDFIAIESDVQYTEENIREMHSLLERVEQLYDNIDTNAYWQVNDELFAILVSVISSAALRQNTESLFLQTARSWAFLLTQNWRRSCDLLKREIETELQFMEMQDRKGVVAAWKCYVMLSFRYCHGI